jgi:hypothetical protein
MFLLLFQYFMIYDEQRNREIKKKTTKIFYFYFFEEHVPVQVLDKKF